MRIIHHPRREKPAKFHPVKSKTCSDRIRCSCSCLVRGNHLLERLHGLAGQLFSRLARLGVDGRSDVSAQLDGEEAVHGNYRQLCGSVEALPQPCRVGSSTGHCTCTPRYSLRPSVIRPARLLVFSRMFSVKTGTMGRPAASATRANPSLLCHNTG